MKRLISQKNIKANDESIFSNLSVEGRELLKNIQLYKNKISQSANAAVEDKAKKKLEDCVKDLNNVMGFIYSFVFDLENYEFVESYNKKTEFTVPKDFELNIEDIDTEETINTDEEINEEDISFDEDKDDVSEMTEDIEDEDVSLDEETE